MSAQSGRVLNGRYRLIKTVGVGSQASVWVAEHLALTTQVAVKLIDPDLAKRPDARERFKREATAAAQLRSPHVVQILDHGIDGDQPFIVMELLEGEDLFQRLEKRHHLSVKDTSKIVTQIARALTRAHAAGVVHRDLKPENIFLTHNDDDEIVKVLDFGVAKVRDAAKVTMQKTGVGTLIGTPHYMSPEQVKGIGEVDFRTDLWAMGVLAYQCVTGELPFDSEGVGDLLIKITIGDMPVPSKVLNTIPPAFDAWFARACDRDASRRFATARAAAEALARMAGLASAGASPTAVPRPGASIPPPVDPRRVSELPPPKPTKPSAEPPPSLRSASPPPPDEVDDEDWEEAEPMVSVMPPPGSNDETMPLPSLPLSRISSAKPAIPKPAALPKGVAAPSATTVTHVAPMRPPPSSKAPSPSNSEPETSDDEDAEVDSAERGRPSRPSRNVGPSHPSATPREVPPSHGAAASPPQPVAPAQESAGPINPFSSRSNAPLAPNPFLVDDFVSAGPHQASPPGPPSPAYATPQPPSPTALRSTVSGVASSDIDLDDEELAFGKNRRKRMVRWLALIMVLVAFAVTWMVVSSQFRGGDPAPEVATAPPATATTAPPAPSHFDPVPTATTSGDSATSAAPTTPPKPTVKPRPGGPGPGVRPKKPDDGSVELPTPGQDPDLPPPAP